MPKLICPRCMKSVDIPDDFAGREATCPACAATFDAPAKYTPAVLSAPVTIPEASRATAPAANPPTPEQPKMSPEMPANRPAPPPGLVPPLPPLSASASPAAQADAALPAGYTHARGFSLNPRCIAWMPAVLLTIALFSTFFPWVGTYLGGYPVYSQGPWRAMFGSVNRNFALEGRMQIPGGWLDKVRADWELLVPALLLLVSAVCLAWADRGFRSLDPRKIPPLARIWPWRQAAIALLAAGSFTFLVIQATNGFGMQRAISKTVSEQFAKEREEAGVSQSKLAEVDYKEEQELTKFNVERTTWLYLALACNLLAAVAMLAHIGLQRRGAKPPPRFVLQY